MTHLLPRRLTRRLTTVGCALALVAGITACGGDADSTDSTVVPAAETPADGSAPAGGFDPAAMQASIESFRQCLVDLGLDVADVTLPTGGGPGGGGTPPDGSVPQPPDGGGPGAGGPGGGMTTERMAQVLGLDTTDTTVAAALDACASTLETT